MVHQSQLASVVSEILEHHLSFKLNARECHSLANKFGIGPLSTAFLQEPEALAMALTNTTLSCQPLVAIFADEAGKRTAATIMGQDYTPAPLQLEPLAQSWHCPLICGEAVVGTDYSRGDDSGFSSVWPQLSSSDAVVACGEESYTPEDMCGLSTATFAEAQQAEGYNSLPDDVTTEPDGAGVISWQHSYDTPWAEGFAEYLAASYTVKAQSEVLAGDAFIGNEISVEPESVTEPEPEASAAQGKAVVKAEPAIQVTADADQPPAVKVKLPHGARRKLRAEKKAAKKAARRAALLQMQAKQQAQQQGVGMPVGQSDADGSKAQAEPQPAPAVPEPAAVRATAEAGSKPATNSTHAAATTPPSTGDNPKSSNAAQDAAVVTASAVEVQAGTTVPAQSTTGNATMAQEASTTEAAPKPAATATPQQGTADNTASTPSAQGEDSATEAEVEIEDTSAPTPPQSMVDQDSAADSEQSDTSQSKPDTAAKSKGKGKSTKQPSAATPEQDAPPREAVLLLGWLLFVLTQGKSALVGMHNVLLMLLKTFGVLELADLKQVAGRKRVSFSKSLQLLEDVGKVAIIADKVVWLAPHADFDPLSQPLYPLEEKRKNGLKGKDRLLTNVLSVGSLNDGLMSQTAATVLAAMQQYKAVCGEQLRLLLGLKKRNFARAVSFLVRLEVLLDHEGNLYLLPSSKDKPQTLVKRYEKQQREEQRQMQAQERAAAKEAAKANKQAAKANKPVKATSPATAAKRPAKNSTAPQGTGKKSAAPKSTTAQGKRSSAKHAASKAAAKGTSGRRQVKAAAAKSKAPAKNAAPAADTAILQPEMSAAYAARSYAESSQATPAYAASAAESAVQHTPVQTSLVSHLDADTEKRDLHEGSRSSAPLALFAGSAADAASGATTHTTATNAVPSHNANHAHPQGKAHPQGE